ncbi:MAG TPA: hypothetical protein VK522_07375 [Pseudolabrys sp.]|nr:hypothetical protein [Pseudolabrys sp.]
MVLGSLVVGYRQGLLRGTAVLPGRSDYSIDHIFNSVFEIWFKTDEMATSERPRRACVEGPASSVGKILTVALFDAGK